MSLVLFVKSLRNKSVELGVRLVQWRHAQMPNVRGRVQVCVDPGLFGAVSKEVVTCCAHQGSMVMFALLLCFCFGLCP